VYFEVLATGINRAELLQRQGKYPPPKNGSPILGLEGAGYVLGENLERRYKACALLNGGGYSQLALVDERHVLVLPEDFDFVEAASIPEAWITAYMILRYLGKVEKG
jgi:tumor protein p53-inducible protein 3